MTTPFETYTMEQAEKVIGDRFTEDEEASIAFYNGDHWQEGKGWIGPMHDEGHALYSKTLEQIEKTFISHNVIAELVGRHVDGVLARELHWKFVDSEPIPQVPKLDPVTNEPMIDAATGEPIMVDGKVSPEVEALISEAENLLVTWWNERNVLETLKNALAGVLLCKRALLRFSIPPGLRNERGELPSVDMAGALDFIYLDHMGFDEDTLKQVIPSATVYTDKNTRKKAGIFTYQEKLPDGTEGPKHAELTYLDDQDQTILRIIGEGKGKAEDAQEGQDAQAPPSITMNLGGRLLMYEMTRPALITKQICSEQKSLNKTLTMKDRNDTQGGFLERYLINTKWPTKEEKDPKTGEITYVPAPMYIGAGTTNALQGEEYIDETGVTRKMEPKVQFRDPVPATTFIDSGNHTYTGMLKEGKQLHYSMAGESVVSGESRKQSRDAFTKDLQNSGNVIESSARWTLETALAQASFLANQAGRYERLRAYVQAKIDPGPISADDLRAAADMIDRGVWDWEYGVSQTGVDDVDAMKQRLERQRIENEARTMAFEGGEPGEGEDGEDVPAEGEEGSAQFKGLNGIQIRAAVEIMDRVADGSTSADNAVDLLTSLGIDEEKARRLVGQGSKQEA